ncbi:MAG: TatD family hydrolase [Pseudomonadota bacterium]
MPLIDSHVHLDFPAFDPDRAAVVARARAAGVERFVLPSVTEQRWSAVAAVAAADRLCHAAYGLHPCYLDAHGAGAAARLEHWLDDHDAVAVGECGLDFHVNARDTEAVQLSLFDAQIAVAAARRLPVIVHARKAVDLATQRVRRSPGLTGVFHSFSGSWQQACALIDRGFHLGIGGAVTHDRATRLRELVRRLPDDVWVLETDAPDQPGARHRGERNEPAYLPEVVDCVAALRAQPVEHIVTQAERNTAALFGLARE